MKKQVIISSNRQEFLVFWSDGKTKDIVSTTVPLSVPLNRTERVQKMAEVIPENDRDIEISASEISIQALRDFEMEKDVNARIHIHYGKEDRSDDNDIIAVWERLKEPQEIFSEELDPNAIENFESRKMKVFTIPLVEGVIIISTSNKWTCAHFPINNGIVGEVISEISKGSYMMKCRPELLLIRDILPELKFKINIKDKEIVKCDRFKDVDSGYISVTKDQRNITAILTHTYIP